LKLFRVFDVPKRAPRCEARLFGTHSPGGKFVLEELEMRLDFPREISLGPMPAKGHQEAVYQVTEL
jgi:hypothetical protein